MVERKLYKSTILKNERSSDDNNTMREIEKNDLLKVTDSRVINNDVIWYSVYNPLFFFVSVFFSFIFRPSLLYFVRDLTTV